MATFQLDGRGAGEAIGVVPCADEDIRAWLVNMKDARGRIVTADGRLLLQAHRLLGPWCQGRC